MKKKVLAWILCIAMLFTITDFSGFVRAITVFAENSFELAYQQYGDGSSIGDAYDQYGHGISLNWAYKQYGDGLVLTGYLGSNEDVYVPSVLEANGEKKNVLKLGDNIFKNNHGINSVTLGEGILEIGESAFYGAENLVCIVTPESLTTIGKNAFYGCKNYNSVILYDSVTDIGEGAFSGCEKLTVYCNKTPRLIDLLFPIALNMKF